MLKLSKKCEYALSAILELALRQQQGPVKATDIAQAQQVSTRFLEVILNELKHGGFVESRRGNEGGYLLAKPARQITVGEVIQYIQGPFAESSDRQQNAFPFDELWQEIAQAVASICESKTFADMAREVIIRREKAALTYVI